MGKVLSGELSCPCDKSCCLLKQNRVIAPDEIHESHPGKNIYHKDSKLLYRSSGQTVQTEISLLLRNQSD